MKTMVSDKASSLCIVLWPEGYWRNGLYCQVGANDDVNGMYNTILVIGFTGTTSHTAMPSVN